MEPPYNDSIFREHVIKRGRIKCDKCKKEYKCKDQDLKLNISLKSQFDDDEHLRNDS